ncbi:DinB family protein [Enemella evansiae]|uniref:DinB family protein n=1 Tax=Enemella evansiae TaxID=2016499 RepID=UPI000B9793B6|nr:DinB family protein [Enemella evansiae]OYO04194.1 serine/arginine repetitive matrix protein 1 [Enemella evansiae]
MQTPPLPAIIEQIDWHWTNQLRPRFEGLTDEEYRWEPVPGSWTIHPRGTGHTPMAAGGGEVEIDFAYPEPDPAPVTTIAWRLGHVIVGVLAVRNANHFGGPPADYLGWQYAWTADGALQQLDEQYATWLAGVRGLSEDDLGRPVGAAEGPWAERPMIDLLLHINRELIHHGAEIALLRDLYAHR